MPLRVWRHALTLQSDGKIVIGRRVGSDFALARLHAETTGQDVRHYVQHDANFKVTATTTRPERS